MAPLVRGRKGQHKDVLAAIRKAGFVRVRVDGEVVDLDQVPRAGAAQESHDRSRGRSDRAFAKGSTPGWPSRCGWRLAHGEGAVLVSYLVPPAEREAGQRHETGTNVRLAASSSSARCTPARNCKIELRGARAAHVQLQQPLRRLPDVRRPGLACCNSIPTW